MTDNDKSDFKALMADVHAFYRRDLSKFALQVWWQACQSFDIEQVSKALTAHTMDPERSSFMPMPGDIVKHLQGTRTDRSLMAWGKVLDGMQRVGAYETVCFDEGLIHAVIEDMGGWVKLCRSELTELPHVQRRFCETYRAYVARGGVQFPPVLPGAHDAGNALRGYSTAMPVLIGDPQRAGEVLRLGVAAPKTQITGAAAALALPGVLKTTVPA
jgi:hypothetical protein